jgi:hypothetical protein
MESSKVAPPEPRSDLARGAPAATADDHPGRVHGDPRDPGLEALRVTQVPDPAPRGDEGLLGGVGGVGFVADDGEGQAVHGTHPINDDRLERFEVSPPGTLDDARVQRGSDGVRLPASTHLMPVDGLRFILLPLR